MTDMTRVIKPKSDQLNADDLIGGTMTVTVTAVDIKGGQDQPVSVRFEGDNGKPYKPCKSMCRVMVTVWGADAKQYVGKSMTLYRDPKVTWGGMEVGGIRISHMSHIDQPVTMALTASNKKRNPYTVHPLVMQTAPSIDPSTKSAGDAAASKGVEAYTAWKDSLAPEIKETIRPYHKQWTDVAIAADAKKGETQ